MRQATNLFCVINILWLLTAERASTGAVSDLRCSQPVADLGEIRAGPGLDHKFTLTNGGDQTLEILEVNRGCGCLAARLSKRGLKPGEQLTLFMEIRTLGHGNGPHSWTAQVRYRQGEAIRELPLAIKAMVKNEVIVQPAVLALHVETVLRQEVVVTDTRAGPFTVKHVQCTGPSKVSVDRVDAGKHKITVEVQAKNLRAGRSEEILNIYTSDPDYAHLQVPVTLTKAERSPVLVTPERVEIHVPAGQKMASTLVRLRSRGSDGIEIRTVTWGPGIDKCIWAKGPDLGATLKIQVDALRLNEDAIDSHVRIDFGQPKGEVLVIPVSIKKD